MLLPLDFFEKHTTVFCRAMRKVLKAVTPEGPKHLSWRGGNDERYHYFEADGQTITVDTRTSDITTGHRIVSYGYEDGELGDLARNVRALKEVLHKKHDVICHNMTLTERLLTINDLIEVAINDCYLSPDLGTWMTSALSQVPVDSHVEDGGDNDRDRVE